MFDALIVLGCRVRNGALSHASLRRVEQAARTYREHGALLVIASGGMSWQGFLEADVFARGLEERGVPAARLLEERHSFSTRGNARGVADLLRGQNARTLGLVTCDWHIPRAMRLFRCVGLSPSAVPAASPPRPLHVVWGRKARERLSLTLDLMIAATWPSR